MARRSSAVGARVAAEGDAAAGAGFDRLPLPFMAGTAADFAVLPPPDAEAEAAVTRAARERGRGRGAGACARRMPAPVLLPAVAVAVAEGTETDAGLQGLAEAGVRDGGGEAKTGGKPAATATTTGRGRGKARKSGGDASAGEGAVTPAGVGERLSLAGGRSFEDGAEPVPPGFDRWLEQARGLGLGPGELVWELHVVQGRSLPVTARLLGMPCAEAADLHARGRARAGERAPKSEADFQAVREEVRDRLVSIIEDASRAPDDPRLLAVRQRACDQMADLYGLKMQRRGGGAAEETPPVYAPPEDLAALVEARVRHLYGRAGDIEAARKVLGEG